MNEDFALGSEPSTQQTTPAKGTPPPKREPSQEGRATTVVGVVVAGILVGGIVAMLWMKMSRATEEAAGGARGGAVAVELAPIEQGTIVERRIFTGSLAAQTSFDVAAKVSGRIDVLHVDVGDEIEGNSVVAELDDDELVQSVLQAEAELLVARAEHTRATSDLASARRDFERAEALQGRGISSEAEFDRVQAELASREASAQVAEAEVTRREALLRTAEIRRDYAQVRASWHNGGGKRIVGRRYVQEGDTVAVNQPLFTMLDVRTLRAEIYVTERDYARLQMGQVAVLTTDAVRGHRFEAQVTRRAPLFEETSRQALIELTVDNPDLLLKPGMFVRASVELDRAEDAWIVPRTAVVRRDGHTGVFVVNDENQTVTYVRATRGILEGDRQQIVIDLEDDTAPATATDAGAEVEVEASSEADAVADTPSPPRARPTLAENLRVVTLGQHLLRDGSTIRVPQLETASQPSGAGADGTTATQSQASGSRP